MFDGANTVTTDDFKCGHCRQPLFLLLDETPAGSPHQLVDLFCIRCSTKERRKITPTMSEGAGSNEPIHPLPFQQLPVNALLCGQEAAIGKLAPQGICHGAVFQVRDKGNELLSQCATCGKGDTIGWIHAAFE